MKASLGSKLQAPVPGLTLWGLKKAGERSSVVCGLIMLSESQSRLREPEGGLGGPGNFRLGNVMSRR